MSVEAYLYLRDPRPVDAVAADVATAIGAPAPEPNGRGGFDLGAHYTLRRHEANLDVAAYDCALILWERRDEPEWELGNLRRVHAVLVGAGWPDAIGDFNGEIVCGELLEVPEQRAIAAIVDELCPIANDEMLTQEIFDDAAARAHVAAGRYAPLAQEVTDYKGLIGPWLSRM